MADNMKQIEKMQGRIFYYAKRDAKKTPCKKCKSTKHITIVPLYEYNPFLPSVIWFWCKKCRIKHIYLWEDNKQAKWFADELQKKLDSEGFETAIKKAEEESKK